MRIGEVAAEAGVNLETLRYYERRGLIQEPRRTEAGHRAYSRDTVRLIRFIKRAQELGFTLGEVQELLALRESRGRKRSDVRKLAAARLGDIEGKMRRLRAMRHALRTLLDSCACAGSRPECPILEALDDEPLRRGGRT